MDLDGTSHGLQITYTALKINMEHNNGGLEDDFPFQGGRFLGLMFFFRSPEKGPFQKEDTLPSITPRNQHDNGKPTI